MSVKKGTSYIAGRAQVDATPVSGSTNAVSSGGVYTALQDKAPASLTASVAALDAALSAKANNNQVMHLAGTEKSTGSKGFPQTITLYNSSVTKGTAPDSTKYWGLGAFDNVWPNTTWQNSRLGVLEWSLRADNSIGVILQCLKNEAGSTTGANLEVGFYSNGNAYSSAPPCNNNNSIVTTVAHSYGRNGYCKLGNGLIIQWGEQNRGSSATITFPTAFSNTNYSIVIIGQNAQRYSWTTGKTTTNCTFNSADDSSQNNDSVSQWVAIGY